MNNKHRVKSFLSRKLIIIFLFGLCVNQALAQDLDSLYTQTMLKNGAQAPDFLIDSVSNTHLSDFRGRYVVLHFWASWCPDCRKDIPEMNRLYDEFASDSVIFIHISFDTEREKWQNYLGESGMDGIQLCEFKKMKESATATAYGIKWIPSVYVLNTAGRVILQTVTTEKLRKRLQLLDKSKVYIPRSKREAEPTFPGGDDAMMLFLSRNIKYPRLASNYGLEGQTLLKFLVNTDGSISNVRVIDNKITKEDRLPFRTLPEEEKRAMRKKVLALFAEEGIRVVESMPRWKAGVRYGMQMKTEYELPINYKIQYKNDN